MSVPRLELFLHGSSRAGREARAQVESLRSQPAGAPLELTITDLERQPEAGKALGVLLTPTLVRRDLPGQPRAFGSFADVGATLRALSLAEGNA